MTSNISNTVEISNISYQTSEEELRTFFSFCGDITHLLVKDVDSPTKSATIVFDSDAAVKTALLIDNTPLGGNLIHVKPAVTPAAVAENISSNRSEGGTAAYENHPNGYQFSQSEKPRTRILAEYIAYGYHIANVIIEKGIEFDKTNGISVGFQRDLKDFDTKFTTWDSTHHVSERARQTDKKDHVLNHAKHIWNNIESCFERALGTSKGLKLRHLYQDGSKEVHDVHNEARHLADLMNEEYHGHDVKFRSNTESVECTCGSAAVYCTCSAGTCHCNNCPKNSGLTEIHRVNSGSISNGHCREL